MVTPVEEFRQEGDEFLPVWRCGVVVEPEAIWALLSPDLLERVVLRQR